MPRKKLVDEFKAIQKRIAELDPLYEKFIEEREYLRENSIFKDEAEENEIFSKWSTDHETKELTATFEELEQLYYQLADLTQRPTIRKYIDPDNDMTASIAYSAYEELARNVRNREELNHAYH